MNGPFPPGACPCLYLMRKTSSREARPPRRALLPSLWTLSIDLPASCNIHNQTAKSLEAVLIWVVSSSIAPAWPRHLPSPLLRPNFSRRMFPLSATLLTQDFRYDRSRTSVLSTASLASLLPHGASGLLVSTFKLPEHGRGRL